MLKGQILSDEQKKKISIANLGKRRTIEQKLKISQMTKIGMSKLETRQKLRLANLGKKISENTKQKISRATKGRKISSEAIAKLKLRNIGNKHNLGKHHSEEAKEKIRLANIGRKHTKGALEKMSLIRKGKYANEKNPLWKGNKVSYFGLHLWLKRNKHKNISCEICGASGIRIEFANISGKYLRDVNDYKSLCNKCHANFDAKSYIKRGLVRKANCAFRKMFSVEITGNSENAEYK